MNVWYVNSILGTFRLEEENDAICGLTLCPDGVPELEPLPGDNDVIAVEPAA